MNDGTDQLIELLMLWKQYRQEKEDGDSISFANWLLTQQNKPNPVGLYTEDIKQFVSNEAKSDLDNAALSMLWGQVDNYRAMIFKNSLRDLDLNGIDEYTLLLYVELYKTPSKKDYVKESLLEPTTCFEMIRRLQRKGFIFEEVNPADRRSTLMRITPSGSRVLQEAKNRLIAINRSMYNHLNESDKQMLIDELKRMITTVANTLQSLQQSD
ncbi:hypothetical protein BN8_04140 [Fibrisoma limi BUZ 3]|uniref:HTH marR-type domain-containing protein n=1 Tax=Fibrisoma limi BUZ 3 TaxID=1185876 RepID=I2GLZ5_9BACT|nr:MarR family winged helix-turn-helix transcriptional regulator [Fibrisoma limi]CCH54921.1 hypothetical protein BN8_04140 [Fibrisoma limi BUZ 3]